MGVLRALVGVVGEKIPRSEDELVEAREGNEVLDEGGASFGTLAEAGSPPEVAAKQAELAKEAFEKALGNMREFAEMVTKAQQGAIDTMSGRISQSLDELKHMALKMKEPSATKTQPTAKATTANA